MTIASDDPTTAEAIGIAVQSYLEAVNGSFPGTVVSYDSAKQTADVQPVVERGLVFADGDELSEPLPVIPDVPVVFFRAGNGFFMAADLVPGDKVLVTCADRSIDGYMAGSGTETTVPAGDLRRFDLSDAVAFPGLYPVARAIKARTGKDLVVGREGGAEVRFSPDGTVSVTLDGSATDEAVALAKGLKTLWGLAVQAFATHTHTSAAPGSPTSPPAAPWPSFDDAIESTLLLVKKG